MPSATFGKVTVYSAPLRAQADLSDKLHHIMRFAGEKQVDQASHASATFANGAIGVLQDKPTSLQAASVAYQGESKVVAGASITAGRLITTNGSGRAAHAGSGDIVIGRALTAAGADGEKFTAVLNEPYRLIGTN